MELIDFIKKFETLFEAGNIPELTADTVYKELEDWSSLIALSTIALIDEEYNVTIKGKDFRESETIEDLFNVVKSLL